MEIQGCDETCDMICNKTCGSVWEPCIVTEDHGRTCNVRVLSDGEIVENVLADRFLRMPAAAVNKRQRRGQ